MRFYNRLINRNEKNENKKKELPHLKTEKKDQGAV
jgi:hypothetical protein